MDQQIKHTCALCGGTVDPANESSRSCGHSGQGIVAGISASATGVGSAEQTAEIIRNEEPRCAE